MKQRIEGMNVLLGFLFVSVHSFRIVSEEPLRSSASNFNSPFNSDLKCRFLPFLLNGLLFCLVVLEESKEKRLDV